MQTQSIYPTAPADQVSPQARAAPPLGETHELEGQQVGQPKPKGVLGKVKHKAKKLKEKLKKASHTGGHDHQDREFQEGDAHYDDYDDEDEDEGDLIQLDGEDKEQDNVGQPRNQYHDQLRSIGALDGHKELGGDGSETEIHGGRSPLAYSLLDDPSQPSVAPTSLGVPAAPMSTYKNAGPPGAVQAVPTTYNYGAGSLVPPLQGITPQPETGTGYVGGTTPSLYQPVPPVIPSAYSNPLAAPVIPSAYSDPLAALDPLSPGVTPPFSQQLLQQSHHLPTSSPGESAVTSNDLLKPIPDSGSLTPPAGSFGIDGKGSSVSSPPVDAVYPDDLVKPNPEFGSSSPIARKIGVFNDDSGKVGSPQSSELNSSREHSVFAKPLLEGEEISEVPTSRLGTSRLDAPNDDLAYSPISSTDGGGMVDASSPLSSQPPSLSAEDVLVYKPTTGPSDLRDEPFEANIGAPWKSEELDTRYSKTREEQGTSPLLPTPVAINDSVLDADESQPRDRNIFHDAAVGMGSRESLAPLSRTCSDKFAASPKENEREKSWSQWTGDKLNNTKETEVANVGLGTNQSTESSVSGESGSGRDERSWGQWTGDKLNNAKNTVSSTVGIGNVGLRNSGLPEDGYRGTGRSEVSVLDANDALEDPQFPTSEVGEDKKSWGSWAAEKAKNAKDTVVPAIQNVKGTVVPTAGTDDKNSQHGESEVRVLDANLENPEFQTSEGEDRKGWGSWAAEKAQIAKDTVAPAVQNVAKNAKDTVVPAVQNVKGTVVPTPGTVGKNSQHVDTVDDQPPPTADYAQYDETNEPGRGTVDSFEGKDEGVGQWATNKIGDVKNSVASTVGFGTSGSTGERENKDVEAVPYHNSGERETPAEGTAGKSWGQWAADKIASAKNMAVSNLSSPRPSNDMPRGNIVDGSVDAAPPTEVSNVERSFVPGEGAGSPASNESNVEKRDKESWGKWTADKLSNAKDAALSTVVMGTNSPTIEDAEELEEVSAPFEAVGDKVVPVKDYYVPNTLDTEEAEEVSGALGDKVVPVKDYYDPNTLDNDDFAKHLRADEGEDSDNREGATASLSDYATGTFQGLRDAFASTLGYGSRKEDLGVSDSISAEKVEVEPVTEPVTDVSTGHERGVEERNNNEVEIGPVTDVSTGHERGVEERDNNDVQGNDDYTQKLMGTTAAVRDGLKSAVASAVGYGVATPQDSKSINPTMDAGKVDFAPTATDVGKVHTYPDEGALNTFPDESAESNKEVEGKAEGAGSGYTEKLLGTTAAARDYLSAKVGYGNKGAAGDDETGQKDHQGFNSNRQAELGGTAPAEKDLKGPESYRAGEVAGTSPAQEYLVLPTIGGGLQDSKKDDVEGQRGVGEGRIPSAGITSTLSPREEDKALSQLITDKISSTAASLKQMMVSPRASNKQSTPVPDDAQH